MTDLAQEIIAHLGRTRAKTPAVLRKQVAARLDAAGVDAALLRTTAIALAVEQHRREREARDQAGLAEARLSRLTDTWPTAPTPERVRAHGEAPSQDVINAGGGGVPPLVAHRLDWPVDAARHMLTLEEHGAAVRLRSAYLGMHRSAGVSNYSGASRGAPHDKLALTPQQERCGREWRALWMRLNPTLRFITWNFILCEPAAGRSSPMTRAEFGRMYGQCSHRHQAAGVADGAIKTACAVLASLVREYDGYRRQERRSGA